MDEIEGQTAHTPQQGRFDHRLSFVDNCQVNPSQHNPNAARGHEPKVVGGGGGVPLTPA